jgi:small subunit ribosomal protein S2
MAVVTMRQLLDSGVHFGHQTRRWNPKMKRFIFTERSGIYIIDLQQSLGYIDDAYEFVKQTVARGGNILFVGTKKQAQEAIAEQATRVNQPYVNQRWLGGLLTNFQTVTGRLERMKELEQLDFEGTTSGFTKKELLLKRRELEKLQKSLGGIRNMAKTPSALWAVDTKRSTSPSTRRRSSASRSSRSSTPTAIPTRSPTRSRATTTRSARSRCSPA